MTSQTTCSTNGCSTWASVSLKQRLIAGAIGGIAGGAVYAIPMVKLNMFPLIAMMMGLSSPLVGIMVHAMISVIFGLGLGLLLRWIPSCPGKSMMAAIAYGVLLWVVGPLLILPLMMGAPVFDASTEMAKMALYWHIIFALVALVVARIYLRIARSCR